MGLDAFVPCRCWEEGRCKPPPKGYEIIRDPEEGVLDAVNYRDPDLHWEELADWRYSSCEHDEGMYASERISSWGGLRGFTDELARLEDRFPVLLSEIPFVNGGSTSPESARVALQELATFERSELGLFVRLFGVPSGELITDRIESHDGVFVFGGKCDHDFGLDDCALYIRSRETHEVVFRSKRFTRSSVGEETLFTDIESGRGCQVPINMLGGAFELPPPSELKVVAGRQIPSDYEFITSALRRIFAASVRVGLPVYWC